MWKVALFLVLLFVAGHFAVRYLRTNPLDPVIESGELVVETREHKVRFALEGPLEATYLVTKAKGQDWSDEPANAALSVVDFATTKAFLGAHPDFHAYGSVPDLQLENLSAPLALVAGNRLAYGELLGLIDQYTDRVHEGGKWICLTISGEALRVTAAESLGDGSDSTAMFVKREDTKRSLLATRVRVEDCAELLAPR
jgi:hypothetical protein